MGSGRSTASREQAPDLILADVVMPEKNGYEVCEAIKASPATARIPVILLSGTFEPFDRDRAERLGCDAIVSKPFDSQQLLRQVEALLARGPRDVPSASTMAIPIMAPEAAAPPSAPPAPVATPADRATAESGLRVRGLHRVHPRSRPTSPGGRISSRRSTDRPTSSRRSPPSKRPTRSSRSSRTPPRRRRWCRAGRKPLTRTRRATRRIRTRRLRTTAGGCGTRPKRTSTQRRPRLRLRRHPRRRRSGCRGSPSRSSPRFRSRADDSASHRKAEPAPERADEGPTQAIPLSADYASLRSPEPAAAPARTAITDETAPALEEHTEEIPIVKSAAVEAPPAGPLAAPAAAEEPATVPSGHRGARLRPRRSAS